MTTVVRRIVMGVGAALLIVVGGLLIAAAVGLQSAFGWQGAVTTELGTVAVPSGVRAIVLDIDGVTLDSGWPVPGRAVLSAAADSGELAMLDGNRDEVDALLGGVGFAVVHRSGDAWAVTAVPGSGSPAGWQQTDWRASDVGAAPEVPISGPTSVVIMRRDGAALPDVAMSLVWRIADPRAPIIAFGVAGALLLLAGFALAWAAVVVRFRRV